MKHKPNWEAPLRHDTKIHRRLLPEKRASDRQKPRFTQDMVCMFQTNYNGDYAQL